jgi:iron complex outermembrane recepter protein
MRHSEIDIRAAKKNVRRVALAKLSLSALLMSALPGIALGQSAEPKSIEEITVTSSRVVRDGFQAPTPTTVIGAADIQNAAQINVFNYLSQLPALAGNVSTQSGNNLLSNGIQGIDANLGRFFRIGLRMKM